MKNLYLKIESLTKMIIFSFFLLAPTTLISEINVKKWREECKKKKKNCFIAIKAEISVPNSDKKQTIATTYIQLGSKTERKMDLIDGKEKTYKLKEEDKPVPIIFVRLPLNTNLTKKPLVQIDKKPIVNVNYSHCNNTEGCTAFLMLNDEVIKFFKAGKELTVTFAVHGTNKNIAVNFPLKGFTKSYDRLLK